MYVEARAGLSREFAVAVYRCAWVLSSQELYQVAQSFTLRWCSRVLWCLAVSSAAANIADANTSGVVSAGVRAGDIYWSARVHRSVAVYDVVVADTLPASLLVPAVDIGDGKVSALWCGRAVYNNLVDLTHISSRFVVLVVGSFVARIA